MFFLTSPHPLSNLSTNTALCHQKCFWPDDPNININSIKENPPYYTQYGYSLDAVSITKISLLYVDIEIKNKLFSCADATAATQNDVHK